MQERYRFSNQSRSESDFPPSVDINMTTRGSFNLGSSFPPFLMQIKVGAGSISLHSLWFR